MNGLRTRARRRARRRCCGEEGAALVLALLFLTISAVTVATLLGFANTSSNATIAMRAARGADYDADAAMQAAIATIRVDPTQGYVGSCNSYTPSWTLNVPSSPVHVDCYPFAAPASERRVILLVCPGASGSCTDSAARLRADVVFYDDSSFGRAVSIVSWSNQ